MKEFNALEKSEEIIKNLFSDKLDKGGYPYLDHLYEVSNRVSGENTKIIGLLHDVIEDTNMTAEDLKEAGFAMEIIEAIQILTRKDNEDYREYIDRIVASNNIDALNVKLADLNHNMDISRIKNPTIKDMDRVEKRYRPAYIKIQAKLEELK